MTKCAWGKHTGSDIWKRSWAVESKISGWKWLLRQTDAYLLDVYEPAENVIPIKKKLRRWIKEAEDFLKSPDCIHEKLETCQVVLVPDVECVADEAWNELIDKFFSHKIIV